MSCHLAQDAAEAPEVADVSFPAHVQRSLARSAPILAQSLNRRLRRRLQFWRWRKLFYHEVNALASSMKSQNDATNIKNDIETIQE